MVVPSDLSLLTGNMKELDGLSEAERKAFLQIISEMSQKGSSEIYEELLYADYKEKPTDIITFIKDPKYLGSAWHLPDGTCKLYPYWEKRLKELFPDPVTTNVNNVIFSGSRGLGKSEIAVAIGLYLMHRLMCLKDPYLTLDLKPTEQVAFAFMNITEALAIDIGISKFQNTVQMSPWFMSRGTLSGRTNVVWNPPPFINIIIGSQPRHVIGQAIYYAFFDEISFIQNQDIEKQKAKAIDMIDTAIGGMKTRFIRNGKNPTCLVLASSKRSDKSFLEVHTKKKLSSEGENVFLVDEPIWNVKPQGTYKLPWFKVAQGNKFLASEVIPFEATAEDIKRYRNKGYKIIDVPGELRSEFLDDIDRALCDFAGVSSSDTTKYIAGWRLQNIKHDGYINPFTKEVIEVGNNPKDDTQYKDFFDLSQIPYQLKSLPMFIHLDMSISGDRTGIAGIWIISKRASQEDNKPISKELYYRLAFSFAVKAPRGWQISFEKNRQFIYWLTEQGFNIRGISSDTYQSADMQQQMLSKGYDYSILSVDRIETIDGSTEKICKPYHYLRSTIYEERLEMYDSELLTEELLGLEKDSNGRINHPDGGTTGSKDIADGLCGAVYNASQHAEEFAFDYGESLETVVAVSSVSNEYKEARKQIEVDMNAELMKMFGGSVKDLVAENGSISSHNNSITQNSGSSQLNSPKNQNKNSDDLLEQNAHSLSYIQQGIIPFPW